MGKYYVLLVALLSHCQLSMAQDKSSRWKLITLDPAHFHAALVQKTAYPGVDPNVQVYAPAGNAGLKNHLALVEGYNQRSDQPTAWKPSIYTGPDFFEKMLEEKKGNLVVLAGNNRLKTDYILQSVNAGLNVFADKPMAINADGFRKLEQAFRDADQKKVLLFDIMTERYQVTNALQRALAGFPGVFGKLEKGTAEDPAVYMESVHHFRKTVSGKPLQRPAWYFDVRQQGEGIVDVTTHLVDLVQWSCFPHTVFNYKKDVRLGSASRWPTKLDLDQFRQVTGEATFPDFLQQDIQQDSLSVFANGEINYQLKGVHVKIRGIWNYVAPAGGGDTHLAILRGSRSSLVIRQGPEQGFQPELYVEPVKPSQQFAAALQKAVDKLAEQYPGLALQATARGWKLIIPAPFHLDHEATFGGVTSQYLAYLQEGRLPDWEKSAMLTKYYTTTSALSLAMATAAKDK